MGNCQHKQFLLVREEMETHPRHVFHFRCKKCQEPMTETHTAEQSPISLAFGKDVIRPEIGVALLKIVDALYNTPFDEYINALWLVVPKNLKKDMISNYLYNLTRKS